MPEHDDEQMDRVFLDAYAVLMEQAPTAPTLEQITTIAEAPSRVTSLPGHPHQEGGDSDSGNQPLNRTVEHDKQREDRSNVEAVWEDVEMPAPSETGRWPGVAIALAAAILVVVGSVLVADRDGRDVVTEPAPAAAESDPVPLPSVADPEPPPSVVDSLGYLWSRVPRDEAVFGGDGDQGMFDVTVGGPGLVAVGEEGGDAAVWTSVDGITWSRVPHDEAVFGGDGNFVMDTVIAGGPGLVAIGWEDGPSDIDVVWISVDGLTWTRHEGVFEGSAPNDVTSGGPGLVAVGEQDELGAVVWTSVDGVTWTRVPHDEEVFGFRVSGAGNGMVGVIAGGPGLVAVGSDGLDSHAPTGRARAVVWTSVDGLSWSRVPHDEAVFGGEGDQGMFDVTVGGPGLVAVGENDQGAPVWTSVDGVTWSRVPDDEAVFGGDGNFVMDTVISTNAGLVAVGAGGVGWPNAAVWTSLDGITWARVDAPVFGREGVSDLTVGGPGLVAVGAADQFGAVWVATLEN